MDVSPTVVVGIGRTGCAILSAVDRLARREGVDDVVRLVAVDSNSRDLEAVAPAAAETHRLDVEGQLGPTDRHYLPDVPDLVPSAGTSRRRPLGRLLVDSAGDTGALLESVQSTVASVAEAVADPKASPLSLWLVNSLGGGTGSGAFPLLALLLAESARTYPGSVDVFGAGSLPRLDELDKRLGSPGGEPVHYANAYTALRELRTLMDLDGQSPYPLEVTLDATPRAIRTDAATVEANPFDAYWLLGIEEDDRFDPDYYRRMNEVVAHLVLYVSALDSRDWFSTGQLYSVAGLPIALPTERVREFRRLDAAIEDVDSRLAAIQQERARLEAATAAVSEVLQVDEGGPQGPEAAEGSRGRERRSSVIDEAVMERCRERAATVGLLADTAGPVADQFDRHADELATAVADDLPDAVPAEDVARYLLFSVRHRMVGHELADHVLPDVVRQLEANWLPDDRRADRSGPETGESPVVDPVRHWRETVKPALESRVEAFRTAAEESILPAMFSKPGQVRLELEAEMARAESLARRYERLEERTARLAELRESAADALRERRADLEARLEAKRDAWDQTQAERARLTRQHSSLEAGLQTVTWRDGGLSLPVRTDRLADIEDLNLDQPTIAGFHETGLLSTGAFLDALETGVGSLDEPVEDRPGPTFGRRRGRLGAMAAAGNRELLAAAFAGEGGLGRESLQEELSYRFETIDAVVEMSRTDAVYLLAAFRPVSLEYTSEYQAVHASFTDPSDDVTSLLGAVSDADVERRIAYPELLE